VHTPFGTPPAFNDWNMGSPNTPCHSLEVPASRLRVGWHETQGRRSRMEDFSDVRCSNMDVVFPGFHLFAGVFDGHGGSEAASFAADNLFNELSRRWTSTPPVQRTNESLHQILQTSFVELDRQCLAACRRRDCGTTALVCLIADSQLVIANAGDCRAVLARCDASDGVHAEELTLDHRPTSPVERERIESAGGAVTDDGLVVSLSRQGDSLGVSRAIGDALYKADSSRPLGLQVVSALPDVFTTELTPADWFILLASDGLYDVMTSEESVQMVAKALRSGTSPIQATQMLVDYAAFCKGRNSSGDNITVVLVVRPIAEC